MRKIIICAISILLLISVFAPVCVYADSDAHSDKLTRDGYNLDTLYSGENIVGVKFSGFFFGKSGIAVTVEIYSSENLNLNFHVGDSGNKLTSEQAQTQKQIIEFFDSVKDFINFVDECANTQYNGTDKLPVSDVYRYNSASFGDTLQIQKETYEMLQIARQMYVATNGAFNPAVYRLVDLWGFSSRIYANGDFGLPYDRPVESGEKFFGEGYPLPEQKYVDAFSTPSFTDFSDTAVVLSTQDQDGETQYFVTKNVAPAEVDGVKFEQWLDLGGIAKGYVADGIKAMLESQNWDRYYVDAGSSSAVYGYGVDGKQIELQMADSFDPVSQLSPVPLLGFKVGKVSTSTSGQYIRKYVTDGIEYSHIIDGEKGAPAQTGIKAVMVVIPESNGLWAGKGDCLTTALTVMGVDKMVDFVNGYLKEQNITVIAQYETLGGKKQILTNLDKSQIVTRGKNFDQFGWALKKVVANPDNPDEYEFQYDANAVVKTKNSYKVWLIVLGCVFGVGIIALIVYHVVRGKKTALQKVRNARRDKPFKPADVMAYLAVVLLIAVLFAVVFGGEKQEIAVVRVTNQETDDVIFVYNVSRGRYEINNVGGWHTEVKNVDGGLEVTFTKEVDGENFKNTMKITTKGEVKVKMTDANCSFHKDCVADFDAVSQKGGAIVCSPHRLKIITE